MFETAAKTRKYIGVNPSTFYEARRNETVLRGWFIFDGPDYAKKTGAPITYEMISQTAAEEIAEYAGSFSSDLAALSCVRAHVHKPARFILLASSTPKRLSD